MEVAGTQEWTKGVACMDNFLETAQRELVLEHGAGFRRKKLRYGHHRGEERNHRQKT